MSGRGRGGRGGGYWGGGRGGGYNTGGGGYSGRGGSTQIRGPKDVDHLAELYDKDNSAVSCLFFEPQTMVLFAGYKSGTVRMWACNDMAAADGGTQWELRNAVAVSQTGPVTSLHIAGNPDTGGFLFVGASLQADCKGAAAVYYYSSAVQGVLEGHLGKIDAITSGPINPPGGLPPTYVLFTAGTDRTLRAWVAGPGGQFVEEQSLRIQMENGITKLELQGDFMFVGDVRGKVTVWHVPSKVQAQVFSAHGSGISGMGFVEGHLFTASIDQKIRVWATHPTPAPGAVVRAEAPVLEQPGYAEGSKTPYSMVIAMATLKDLNDRFVVLASYGGDPQVKLFRPEANKFQFGGFCRDIKLITAIAAGPPASGYFFTGSESGRLQVWRFRTGEGADAQREM